MAAVFRKKPVPFEQLGGRLRNLSSLVKYSNSVRDNIQSVLENYSKDEIYFRPFRIPAVLLGTSFSQSGIQSIPLNYNKRGEPCHPAYIGASERTIYNTIRFSVLYRRGLEVLKRYAETGMVKKQYKDALVPLLVYLDNIENHEAALDVRNIPNYDTSDFESGQSAIIANHLLSPLLPKRRYVLCSDGMTDCEECPCSDTTCKEDVHFGSTSIGHKEMFYGNLDMVLFPDGINEFSVVMPHEHDWSIFEDEENTDFLDIKSGFQSALRHVSTRNLCIAQAITFSFYQGNFERRKPNQPKIHAPVVSLIPTMAVTMEEFDIYMYDYEHDVLLRNNGAPVQIWKQSERKIDVSSVLQIWLTIHHNLFQVHLKKRHIEKLRNSCEFQKHCGDKVSKFKNNVMFLTRLDSLATEFNGYEDDLSLDEDCFDDFSDDDSDDDYIKLH